MPESGFSGALYANRVYVKLVDGHFLIEFSRTEGEGSTFVAACFLEGNNVKQNEQEWKGYLKKLARASGEMVELLEKDASDNESRVISKNPAQIQFANVCRFAQRDQTAETRFFCLSVGAAIDAAQGKRQTVVAQPVLWVFTPVLEQARLIVKLYELLEEQS